MRLIQINNVRVFFKFRLLLCPYLKTHYGLHNTLLNESEQIRDKES